MNRLWIFVGLTLLCVAQGWTSPITPKGEDSDASYVGDEAGEEFDDYDISQSEPVQVLTPPETFIVPVGSSVRLPCSFLHAESVAVEWKKSKSSDVLCMGGSLIATGYENIKCMQNNTLLFENLQVKDSGDYVCAALEQQGSGNKNVTHRVIVVDIHVKPNEYNDVNQGDNLTLGCEISSGVASHNMSWARKGERVHATRQTENGIYIDIHNATRHVAGDYQCLIELGTTTPMVKHLTLKVKHVPEIEYEHKAYFTSLGRQTNITCVVHSHPPVTKIQWFKNNKKVKNAIKSDPIKNHHVLTIENTGMEDLGTYYCKATNDLGETDGPVIHVYDTPAQPIFKEGRAVDDYIEFQWSVDSYKPIVEKELLYRKEGMSEWHRSNEVEVISSMGKKNIILGRIRGIEPGDHEVKLRVRNDEEHQDGDEHSKWGPYSELKKFDGEYKNSSDAASTKGSAMRPTISLMTLLLFISPLAFSCL